MPNTAIGGHAVQATDIPQRSSIARGSRNGWAFPVLGLEVVARGDLGRVVRDAWSEGVGARAQYVGSTPWVPPTHRLGKSPKPSEQIILSHVPDP